MRYTFKFGTFFGIPVRIHVTFPLILLAFGLEAWWRDGWVAAFNAVLLITAVFVCVVLHEFGHSLQVRRYGIRVRDIVLLPIGGMARAERIPEKPIQEIVVAISGPLVNFALALILFVILWLRRAPLEAENDFLLSLLVINLVLGLFNLVPAFPMDGGRILRALLATRMSYLDATRHAKNVGQVIAIVFVIAGFYFSQFIMLPLIAVFIFFGAMGEERMVRMKVTFGDRSARDFVRQGVPFLSTEDTIGAAASRLDETSPVAFPVTDSRRTLAGAVETSEVLAAVREGRTAETLAGYVKTGFPLIEGDTPAIQTYYLFRQQKLALAGIVEDDLYLGLLYFDDLAGAVR